MSIRRYTLSLLLSFTGCSAAGPDFVVPDDAKINQPAATQGFAAADIPAFQDTDVPREWWHLYNDPTLDNLILNALQANTDLRIAAANIKRANATLDLAEERRLPETTLAANPSYTRLSAEQYLRPGAALPSDYFYSVAGSLSYKVDLFGQVQRAIESATADTATSQAAYDRIKIGIIAETTRAYLDVCATGEETDILERLDKLQHALSDQSNRLVQAGRTATTDAESYSVQESRTHAALPQLQAQRQTALYKLAAYIGQTPNDLPHEVSDCHNAPSIHSPLPTGDGRTLLKRRPDIRQAEQEFRAATARIGVATADLYPHITLGLSGGSIGTAKRFFNMDTFDYSVGPLISWKFPNRGEAEAHIKGAEAETEAAYAQFDGSVLTALREVETALTVYAHDLERHADLRHAQEKTTKIQRDAEQLMRQGKGNLMQETEAQRAVLIAEQDTAASNAKILADQVNLFHALGGGW